MTSATENLDLDSLLGEASFVRGLARSLLFDEHQVDDVVQQTWIEALSASRVTRSWLATVVRSRASNVRRSHARQQKREHVASRVEALPSTTEMLEREELRRQVVEAVASLPEIHRVVVLLRFYEGMAPRHIARELGISRDAAATRLKRALAMLREQLDAEHGGDRRAWAVGLVPLAVPPARATAIGALVTNLGVSLGALLTMKHVMIALGGALALLVGWGLSTGAFSDAAPAPIEESTRTEVVDSSAPTVDETAMVDSATVDVARTDVGSSGRSRLPASVQAAMAGFRGILVAPDGEPAADQLVRLVGLDMVAAIGSVFDPDRLGDGILDVGTISASARTAADGTFVVDGVPPDAMYAMHAGVGGDHPTWRMLQHTPGPAEIVDLGTVRLTAKGKIIGRVVDQDGEPISDADVWCSDLPGALLSVAPVDRLAPGGGLMIAVPRFELDVDQPEVDARYHTMLRNHFAKRVTESDDDTEFLALEMPSWFERAFEQLPISRAVTDDDGTFELRGAQLGSAVLVVRAEGYAKGGKPRVLVRPDEVRDVGEVRLKRGDRCAGRILDAGGQPVTTADVRVASQPRMGLTGILFAGDVLRVDKQGRFAVGGLPREDVFVAVRRAITEPWVVHGPFDSGDDEIEIRLPQQVEMPLEIRSVDPDRTPTDIRVAVRRGPPLGEVAVLGMQPELPVRTTIDGADAILHDLEPGLYTVQVRAKGHVIEHALIDVGPGREPYPIELEPVAPARLIVTDSDGEPVEGAQVFAQSSPTPAWARSILFGYGAVRVWDELALLAGFSDANGELVVESLPAGKVSFCVRHPAFGAAHVQTDLPNESIHVELAACGVIHGQLFENGVPASGSEHRLVAKPDGDMPMPQLGGQGAIGPDGHYRIEGLAAGPYDLKVEDSMSDIESLGGMLDDLEIGIDWNWGQKRKVSVTVEPGREHEVNFDVHEERAVPGTGGHVHVRASVDGAPAVGYKVQADGSDLGMLDDSGALLSDELVAHDHTLRLYDGPRLVWSRVISIAPGHQTEVDVTIEHTEISGVVLDETGTPAVGHYVQFIGQVEGGTSFVGSKTDHAGAFRARVPRGLYALNVSGARGRGWAGDVDATRGEASCEVRLSSKGVTAGRVVSDIEMRYVSFHRPASVSSIGIEDGVFSTTGMAAGTYRVSLRDAEFLEYDCEPNEVTLTDEGTLDLVFRAGERLK